MDYEEAMEATVSRAQAEREIKLHGLKFADFASEVGDRAEYRGNEVLEWLGY